MVLHHDKSTIGLIKTLVSAINDNATLKSVALTIEFIIDMELMMFSKSVLLTYVVDFLSFHSDGDTINCRFNMKLLHILLTKYYT